MNQIDLTYLDKIKKDKSLSNNKANTISILLSECKNVFGNKFNFVSNLNVFEAASIALSNTKWISVKGKTNNNRFNIRDIVQVDLGPGYGFEMSYTHPCIILDDSTAGFCFVVPCSTGKFGKKNMYILDGSQSDGFKSPTGVLLDSVRCISKTRINHKVGEITAPFLDKINSKLVELYFSRINLKIKNLEKDLLAEREKNKILKGEINALSKTINVQFDSLDDDAENPAS